MKTRYCHRILELVLGVGCWVLVAACSSDKATDEPQPLPEGMGRIRITICTPETNPDFTRAVNTETTWLEPDHDWEKLQSYRILICTPTSTEGKYIIKKIVSGTTMGTASTSVTESKYRQSADITTEIEAGTYYIFATANFADGYTENGEFDLNATAQFPNGYSTTGTDLFGDANPIPMTGKLTTVSGGQTLREVVVTNSNTTDVTDTPLTIWRVISKLQFYFTNEATEQINIYGIEVEPINTNDDNSGLVYLFSKDDLTSTTNLAVGGVSLPTGVTNGKVKHPLTTPTNPLLTLANYAGSGDKPTGTLFFYVNETNGTFTTTQNEISLRFKVKRGDGTEDELRYGMTSRWGSGDDDPKGFNVIRRNDWIHIPIVITDWQYRIEPIAFVPIAGYPVATVSSDGLTATYSTGGMIALQPFIKKKGDVTWVDLGDTRIKDVTISWVNADGDTQSGSGKIFTTPIDYDPHTNYIIGELNNSLDISSYTDNNLTVYTENGYKYFKTTVNIKMKLEGPEDPDAHTVLWYDYSFKCNIILKCVTT